MIGHDCNECGATVPECDATIKEHGQGCCGFCFEHDTHGLLDRFKVIDVADLAQEADNHSRLIAQMVIARGEHANAIRQLRAQVDSLQEAVTTLQARNERAEDGEKRRLLAEVMATARQAVLDLPDRLAIIEKALPEIERKVGLKRRDDLFKPPTRQG